MQQKITDSGFMVTADEHFTVSTLRAVLAGLDGDLLVLVPGYENGADRVRRVRVCLMAPRDGISVYNGEFEGSDSDNEQSQLVFLLGDERI